MTKQMYFVQYLNEVGDSTYEIFDNIISADYFSIKYKNAGVKILYFGVGEFNEDNIYQDENGVWNYEDHEDTLLNILRIFSVTDNNIEYVVSNLSLEDIKSMSINDIFSLIYPNGLFTEKEYTNKISPLVVARLVELTNN